MHWLLVDDFRDLPCADFTARTYKEAIRLLHELEKKIECLVLDHDLGEEKDGYDVLMYAVENGLLPDKVIIVSSNPVGVDRIGRALEYEGFSAKNPKLFIRE